MDSRPKHRTTDARVMTAALLACAAGAWTWAAPASAAPANSPATTTATTAPADLADLDEGPLRVVVTAVEGKVQAKPPGAQKWQIVEVGMELAEGWELR